MPSYRAAPIREIDGGLDHVLALVPLDT